MVGTCSGDVGVVTARERQPGGSCALRSVQHTMKVNQPFSAKQRPFSQKGAWSCEEAPKVHTELGLRWVVCVSIFRRTRGLRIIVDQF